MKSHEQMKKMTNHRLFFFAFLISGFFSTNLYAAGGADASDPTAAVNYSDLRYQSFDLGNTGGTQQYDDGIGIGFRFTY